MSRPATESLDALLRQLAPRVLAALTRRYGRFSDCEDATQDALLAAATQWPEAGVPDNPHAWLVTVGSRRLIDELRAERARRDRELRDYAQTPPAPDWPSGATDDSLTLLLLCAHPALSLTSQIALTLRAVGGLTTAQIAAAFLVPEATMAQRISRAKATVRGAEIPFAMPSAADTDGRLGAVRHVLYLVFNEGHTATAGDLLTAPDLSAEAIRLTRMLFAARPGDTETAGLLALMLLAEARRSARTAPGGTLVPLDAQDRSRWDRALIAEGVSLLEGALPRGAVGSYQLQAAIAAVHTEAPDVAGTDWAQILALYDLLERVAPGPMVTLNRAVAVAMVRGPAAGLAEIERLAANPRLAVHHRLIATRAHLRERAGDLVGAAGDYRDAARRTLSMPERRYLVARARRISPPPM
jgi:RNA polymerase sigma factor (sigma-70 family)